jgi:hypothetical protein
MAGQGLDQFKILTIELLSKTTLPKCNLPERNQKGSVLIVCADAERFPEAEKKGIIDQKNIISRRNLA